MLKKFIIGGVVLLLAISFLFSKGFKNCYYTVSELVNMENPPQNVQVRGKVVPGSLKQGQSVFSIEFILADSNENLPVIYHGVLPRTFREGEEVMVAGRYDSHGILEAKRILTTCHF